MRLYGFPFQLSRCPVKKNNPKKILKKKTCKKQGLHDGL